MKEKSLNVEFMHAEKEMDKGCFNKAINEFQNIIKEFPEDAKSYSKLGVCFAYQKKFKLAREYLGKAITFNAKFAEPYNNLGNIFLEEKNYDKAMEYYRKAINLDANYAAPYSNLGLVYKRLNQYNKAVHYFKKAAEIDRKLPSIEVKKIINHSRKKMNLEWIILLTIGILLIWLLLSR